MKIVLICLSLLIAAASLLLVSGQEESNNKTETAPFLARLGVKLPAFFSFERYRRIYDKHYDSPVEETRRNKVFLSRAFQVFVAYIKYTFRSLPSYLGINHLSDKTPEERKALFTPAHVGGDEIDDTDEAPPKASPTEESAEEVPAVSLDDIEQKLIEIEQHKEESPEYAEISAELAASNARVQQQRRRRRKRSPKETLTVDQLMPDPAQIQEARSPKFRDTVPSNNPAYVRPQVTATPSELSGASIEKPLQPDEASKIDRGNPSFLSSVAGFVKHPFSASKRHRKLSNQEDKLLVDYRQSNCIAEVKDQRACNSCYVFSMMSLFEYFHCVQTGELVPFSEQYVLDCGKLDPSLGLEGCGSSPPESAWMFVQRFGLELASNYPYSARSHSCPYAPNTDVSHMGHTRVSDVNHVDLSKQNMRKEVIGKLLREKGPLVVGLKVDSKFCDYAGGVDKPKNSWLGSRHAMTIVGEGIEGGQEYWLIRNSMGKDWGLKGYYKLSKDVDPKVLVKVSYVEAKFDKNQNHNQQQLLDGLQRNQ